MTTNAAVTAELGAIALTSDEGDIAVESEATAQEDVTLQAEAGDVAINGAVTSTDENVIATAQGDVTIAADVKANKNVTLTSANEGITQAATSGIQAQTVITASAEGVDLQGTGNQFEAITVQSSDGNAPLQGSVLVQDSADQLVLSVQPVVNGDIAVENKQAEGVLQASSELHAEGNGEGAEGDITLKSDGSLQTDRKCRQIASSRQQTT